MKSEWETWLIVQTVHTELEEELEEEDSGPSSRAEGESAGGDTLPEADGSGVLGDKDDEADAEVAGAADLPSRLRSFGDVLDNLFFLGVNL